MGEASLCSFRLTQPPFRFSRTEANGVKPMPHNRLPAMGQPARLHWLQRDGDSPLILQPHVVQDEAINIRMLFQLLRQGLSASMSRLGVNADDRRCIGSIVSLQSRCELERVGRYDTVVVVGSSNHCSRITCARPEVVEGRVGTEVLEHLL